MHLNLLVIKTQQPKALAEFYEQLGIKFQYHRHGKGPRHYSAKIGKLVFEIYPLSKHQENPDRFLRLGFTIADLDALILTLQKQEVEIVSVPKASKWGYYAVVKDPDGRKIELTQIHVEL